MTKIQFNNWLRRLVNAWESKTPNEVLDLIAEKFIWHDAPFDKPITTRDGLLGEWQSILDHNEIKVTYELLSIENNTGIAHWHATFTRLSSKGNAELDGIYMATLDDKGKCTEFHQWYNSK